MHVPVLQKEILKYLVPKSNENFIDCTVGGGGHLLAIVERILPNGRLLGIDWSLELIRGFKIKIQSLPSGSKIKNNLVLVCDNFVNLKKIVGKYRFKRVDGILFDLGMSSWHLAESGRGFSFQKGEPLDMRYNLQNQLTAEKIVNFWSKIDIEKILREYGEEKFAKQIAEKIIEERKIKPVKSTFQLVEVIKQATPGWYHHRRIFFATKTFQALRITVNDELENLRKVLPQTLQILKPGGRLVIISFHSLEDRIVKDFFKQKSKQELIRIITKKPIRPTQEEIKINPRSRSAKLRAMQKIK